MDIFNELLVLSFVSGLVFSGVLVILDFLEERKVWSLFVIMSLSFVLFLVFPLVIFGITCVKADFFAVHMGERNPYSPHIYVAVEKKDGGGYIFLPVIFSSDAYMRGAGVRLPKTSAP